jgi:hypothetical protein
MPLQVGTPTTFKITPRDAGGNPVDSFAPGTPAPIWPILPESANGPNTIAPDGMSITFTPSIIAPDTFGASVVIGGTAVTHSITQTPKPGPAVDYSIDEVVAS